MTSGYIYQQELGLNQNFIRIVNDHIHRQI